ncbi:tetratricopeptide repeat protein [uncultured Gimesia sp.]|uniref:tetratricopeptide repeat protein n=1 Tax=uncultured Gimesia sp. TaxID=1678688 RepID=UPI002610B365|nr:tetratricopeptide repeat protein [uncultured Gimesia sp.]
MQRKLREAMADERAKGRIDRLQRNSQEDSPASLAELSVHAQTQKQLPHNVESQALPLSSTQQSLKQPNPKSVLHELNLAYDADRSGNTEKAQGYYQRVLSLDPNHFEALHRLAILEDKKQNYPAAEAYYLRALKVDSTNADLLSDIGYSYMLQGRDDYGEKYLHEALKHQPGHVRSLDHLGWYYGRSGQYDQALALFRMTSGEAQAQLKFAQLFPGVEPNAVLAQGNMSQYQVQRVAPENTVPTIQPVGQFETGLNQPIQYAAESGSREPTSPMLIPSGNNPTQQIAEMMEREREKAIQARGEIQQLPSIRPNQALAQQPVGFPAPVGTIQETRQLMVNPAVPQVTPTGTPQIQAWPPVGDPGIAQAVEASNYWALKEQQQNQNQTARQSPPTTYQQQQQYQNLQGRQQLSQGQNQRMPAGAPQQRRGQQIPQQMPRQMQQQRRSANVPQAGQRMYGKQYQNPGQFPDNRINSTQPRVQQSKPSSESYQQNNHQQMAREAARTGMNLGPGQMFPVEMGGQNNANGSSLMSAQFPANTNLPASAQVARQNVYQAGGQNIRQAQVGLPLNQQQAPSGIRQVGYESPNQQTSQMNGLDSSAQNWNSGGYQRGASALPQSAMFSNNPAIAPANVRSIQSNTNQQMPENTHQNGLSPMGNQRAVLSNQNANGSTSSPIQWGSQTLASPSRFPVQQNRY